jgi:integrase
MTDEFRIKPYKHPKLKWVVRAKIAGKWVRKYFETKDHAETYRSQKNIEVRNQGREAVEFPSWLRIMAQDCNTQLASHEKTIRDATEHYLQFLLSQAKSVTIQKALDELIQNRLGSGVTDKYCYDLRLHLGKLRDSFPKKLVFDFSTAELDTWLSELPFSPITRNTFRRDLRTFFSFCKNRGYCSTNPAENTRIAKDIPKPVQILTIQAIADLLTKADETIVPFIAIGAFAGLRSSEVLKLDWHDVDFESNLIEVTAKNSKTARRRLVKILPNLDAWIRPLGKKTGGIAVSNLRKLIEKARKDAGISVWPSNALRHSYASYHLAHFNDAAALALQMGHTSTSMIFEHYREVVKPKEAFLYWEIKPTKKGENIVQFAAS